MSHRAPLAEPLESCKVGRAADGIAMTCGPLQPADDLIDIVLAR
jgi:hypothetical protein